MYSGTFQLNASGGPVAGYIVDIPPPPPSNLSPTAAPTADGKMIAGQYDTITVTINYSEVVFTVEPIGAQAPIYVTVSPSFQVIP